MKKLVIKSRAVLALLLCFISILSIGTVSFADGTNSGTNGVGNTGNSKNPLITCLDWGWWVGIVSLDNASGGNAHGMSEEKYTAEVYTAHNTPKYMETTSMYASGFIVTDSPGAASSGKIITAESANGSNSTKVGATYVVPRSNSLQ